MPLEVKLYGHDPYTREEKKLVKVMQDGYRLVCKYDWLRVVGNDIFNPEAIDPSGGPFISVGNTQIIPGKILDRISRMGSEYILYFKDFKND